MRCDSSLRGGPEATERDAKELEGDSHRLHQIPPEGALPSGFFVLGWDFGDFRAFVVFRDLTKFHSKSLEITQFASICSGWL